MEYGILVTPDTSAKAKRFLRAMAAANPKAKLMSEYRHCDVLMLYGLGGADRWPYAESHLQSGKPFVTWDLAYWERFGYAPKFRCSFNSNHPDPYVMTGPTLDKERFEESGIQIRNRCNPSGPIMLVGHGPKAIATGSAGWTAQKSRELRERFPEKQIMYRPKPGRPLEEDVTYDDISSGPIEAALRGMSMVVCRHSNVAVDAAIQGIPVVCDTGAAAAIYPQDFDGEQPTPETRTEFLHRIAWWQYNSAESHMAWQFINTKIKEVVCA